MECRCARWPPTIALFYLLNRQQVYVRLPGEGKPTGNGRGLAAQSLSCPTKRGDTNHVFVQLASAMLRPLRSPPWIRAATQQSPQTGPHLHNDPQRLRVRTPRSRVDFVQHKSMTNATNLVPSKQGENHTRTRKLRA